jgi:hypothetical protein
MGAHSSKHTPEQVKYLMDFVDLKKRVDAYPFSNKHNEAFNDAFRAFVFAFLDHDNITAAAKATEEAYERWMHSMYGPSGYVPSNMLWQRRYSEVF